QRSWPRFATPNDRFTVPLAVFNNSAAAAEATITVRLIDPPDAPGVLKFATTNERRLTLAPVALGPNGQATTSFDITALPRCGVARAALLARMNGETYEEDIELPVRPASPEISTGGYALATPEKPAIVEMPGGMLDGTSRLQLRVTPWPALELPKGLDYLDRYPY